MPKPRPDRMDAENPEWTHEDFAAAIPFSELPAETRALLDSPRVLHASPDDETDRKTAA